jgi:hypothetical protein
MKRLRKILLWTGSLVLAYITFNIVRLLFIEMSIKNDCTAVVEKHATESYSLQEYPLSKQKYYYSCSISTISALKGFYGQPADEDAIIKENGISIDRMGMSPGDVLKYMRISLPGKKIDLRSYIKDSDVLELIASQLKAGIPVPVFYSTPDVTDTLRFGTHYSTVTGISFPDKNVTIANVYGYHEILPFKTFLNYLKHTDPRYKKVFTVELAKFLGVIKNNTLYIVG